MPIIRTRTALEFKRNVRLFLNMEAGLTGLQAIVQDIKRRMGVTAAPVSPARPAPHPTPRGKRAGTDGRSTPPPFFVVGQAKTGTSWIQNTLSSHPDVLCLGEAKFFGRDLKTAMPVRPRPSLYSALADCEELTTWFENNGNWTKNPDTKQHVKNLVRVSIDYLFDYARARSGKPIIGDKTPIAHARYLEEMREFYPEARIVQVIRDGRDQAVSTAFHRWNRSALLNLPSAVLEKKKAYHKNRESFGPHGESIFEDGYVRGFARKWKTYVEESMEKGPRLFGELYFEIRYEELLEEPELYFGKMFGFLGASTDREVVKECVRQNSFERKTGNRTRGTEDYKSFFRKGISGDWKNYFTEQDKQAFKEEAGDLLVELGYERDNDW